MKKALLSISLLVLTQLSAQADSQILNHQINLDNNWSNLNVSVNTVGGNVAAQGAAAGNLIDITTMNNTTVNSNQNVGFSSALGSNIHLEATKGWGSGRLRIQGVRRPGSTSTP